jgi:peroxiredoxin
MFPKYDNCQHPCAGYIIAMIRNEEGVAMQISWIVVSALIGAGVAQGSLRAETEDLSGQGRAEAAGRGLLGSPAPRLVLKTIDGEVIDLGKLYGKKAVYLKFWETWCTPCRQQMPHFEHTYQTAGPDLAVIAVDTGINDPLEDIQRVRRSAGLTMPIVIDDGRLAQALNLRVTPQHVVIGRDGRIQYIGHLADQRLDSALIAARSPSAQPTPPEDKAVHPIARYQVGDRFPDITATTIDGDIFHARDSSEKRPTVLVFFSVGCESYLATKRPTVATRCRQVREQVDSLVHGNSEIRWLGVASGVWATEKELQEYRTQNKLAIPLTLDESGTWFRSFGVVNVPTVLIADAQGQIVRRVEGFDGHLPSELQSLVRKQPIATPQRKPLTPARTQTGPGTTAET